MRVRLRVRVRVRVRVRATPRVPSPLAHLRRRLHAIAETARDREKNASDRELRVHLFRAHVPLREIEGRTCHLFRTKRSAVGMTLYWTHECMYVSSKMCVMPNPRICRTGHAHPNLLRRRGKSVAGAVTPHPGEEDKSRFTPVLLNKFSTSGKNAIFSTRPHSVWSSDI